MKAINTLTRHGLQDSHWGKRILRAVKRNTFTSKDTWKAGNWVSCACGKVTADIPRCKTYGQSEGAPTDFKLKDLGMDFHFYVAENNFDKAARTLVLIEKHAQLVASRSKGV